MKGSFIEKIAQINQIILFIGLCVFIAIISFRLFSELNHRNYEPQVKLIQPHEGSQEPTNIKRNLNHIDSINDVHVFEVLATHINAPLDQNINHFNMFASDTDGAVTTNVLFVDSNNTQSFLFEHDAYILDWELQNFNQTTADRIDPYQRPSLKLSKNMYLVVDSDTNGDGVYSREDIQNLYVSNHNGQQVQLAFKDVIRHRQIEDDLFMIKQRSDSGTTFTLFNVANGNKQILNTDI